MNIQDSVRAEVLAQALPYLRMWAGATVVVKYGGAAMVNEGVRRAVAQDLVLMSAVGIRTILVHGGGPEIDRFLNRLGKEPVFSGGLRVTDEETLEIVQMVLAGKINKDLAALIQQEGGRALGISGADGGLLSARRVHKPGAELGLVGDIDSVNGAVLKDALNSGYIPVVATIALGLGEDEGRFLNINADAAAAAIAVSVGAQKLIFLTDVPGLLRDLQDEGTLISELPRAEIPGIIASGAVSRGMIPKVEYCAKAVDGGVRRAHILDGRSPHALLLELFTDRGVGTMIL